MKRAPAPRAARTAVAVVALYALLVGLYLPGFAGGGGLAFGALCASSHETGRGPAVPASHAGQCCLAACPSDRTLAAPPALAGSVLRREPLLLVWFVGPEPARPGSLRIAARARGPPLV